MLQSSKYLEKLIKALINIATLFSQYFIIFNPKHITLYYMPLQYNIIQFQGNSTKSLHTHSQKIGKQKLQEIKILEILWSRFLIGKFNLFLI